MKERPILFSAPMVRALLAGSKTQTRRVIRDDWWRCLDPDCEEDGPLARAIAVAQCPYGVPGDRLWVRETWGINVVGALQTRQIDALRYRASDQRPGGLDEGGKYSDTERWRPSIHMPRWASRITLEVAAVRVERLNSISEEDAKAEGVMHGITFGPGIEPPPARDAFEAVWDSINGKAGRRWADNPYIWAITFKRVQP